MALTSTLGSPGVEIREVDNSLRLDTSTGTTVYIPGFAAQGPVDEVMSIGSMSDFETIYGVPTNAAERYFYYTVKSILDNTGGGTTVLCTRLPYGADSGDTVSNQYTMLAYPAVPVIKKQYYKFTNKTNGNWRISSKTEHDKNTEEGETLTIPFDQFILTDKKAEDALVDTFTINKVTTTLTELTDEGGAVINEIVTYTATEEIAHPELIDCVLTIDGDAPFDGTAPYEKIEVVQVNSNSSDTNPVRIPELGASIDLTSFDESALSIAAPEIKFNRVTKDTNGNDVRTSEPELKAEGYMALEGTGDDKSTYLHLSYAIKTNVAEDTTDANKEATTVGSLYIKLKYDMKASDMKGCTFQGLSIISQQDEIEGQAEGDAIHIDFEMADAHEIAKTFTGLRESEDGQNSSSYAQDVTYIVGSPVSYQVSLNDYYKILTGEKLLWQDTPYTFDGKNSVVDTTTGESQNPDSEFGQFKALGHAAFVVLNTARTIINGNFEGFYLGITDNMFINPSDEYVFNAITSVKTTSATYNETQDKGYGLRDNFDNTCDYQSLSPSRLTCKLADNSSGAISKILARDITALDISGTNYDDTISMGLFKLTSSQDDSDIPKLGCSLKEKYNWSFGMNRQKSDVSSTKPVSYFAENVVEDSNNLAIMINPNITKKAYLDSNNKLHGKMRIFGTKLVDNLDMFERKYLRNISLSATPITGSVSAVNIAKMAQMSIKAWEQKVAQAGVTPGFIKKNFTAYNASSTSSLIDDVYGKFQPLNSLMPFGSYSEAESESKQVGEIPAKLERALSLVENDELYPDIDIVLESGLGTVYINAKGDMREDGGPTQGGLFDEATVLKGLEDLRTGRTTISDLGQNVKENYLAVQNVFLKFANSYTNGGRGDCFYISDVPRGILIKGKDTKITTLFGTQMEGTSYDITEKVNHSFPTSVYYPINHTFDTIVSSYMSTYAQWVKVLDSFTAKKVWLPISGYIAANMCATDTVYGPWYAAAGLRRGVINGVLDYAISPNVSQRTDLYKICINSVPKIPNYGVTIWGIRTMSKTASAFDQNTCRRTFLYMEKKVKQLLRYYLFEPNNSYTRLQIFNDIDPFLQSVKNGGGVYAYTLVCDTTINTPEVINNGDLAIRITAAPTRTAENIVVEFVANKYTEEIAASEG